MRRSRSEIACDEFRRMFGAGFYAIDPETGEVLGGAAHDAMVAATQPWRDEMLRAFTPLDDQLNPVRAFYAGRPLR